MQTRLAAVLVMLLVSVAGCTGGGGGDGATEPTATPTPGGGGNGGTDGLWGVYDFREGERYEYEFEEFGDPVGSIAWEVLSASGSGDDRTVTIRTSGEVDGEAFDQTVSGDPDSVYTGLLGTGTGTYILLALYSPFVGSFQGEALEVGGGWSYSDGIDSYSYRIDRTDSIAGRDVFVSTVRINDEPVWETWIDPDLALAAKTVIYGETGEVEFQSTLVDYRR
jgi:hypothetical protein